MNEYDEVHKKILFSDSVDFIVQYRYEHWSFHQCAMLDYLY